MDDAAPRGPRGVNWKTISIATVCSGVTAALVAVTAHVLSTPDSAGASAGSFRVVADASPQPTPTVTVTESVTVTSNVTTTATTAVTRTVEPAAPPGPAVFSSLVYPPTVTCPSHSGTVNYTISWTSASATRGWIGVEIVYADIFTVGKPIPASGSYEAAYNCAGETQEVRIALQGTDGTTTEQTFLVWRT